MNFWQRFYHVRQESLLYIVELIIGLYDRPFCCEFFIRIKMFRLEEEDHNFVSENYVRSLM